MPKSKRARLVSLTKTKTDRKELKKDLVEEVRQLIDKYDAAYVFSFENMRTQRFKELRGEWSDSRFLLGKNKVMQLAMGSDADSEYRPGLHQLAANLSGNVGLLFTSRSHEAVKEFFESFEAPDFARAGFVPESSITLPAGKLADMPHTMADTLRKLGVSVRLDKGVIVVEHEHALCREGVAITPEQGRLLKLFGHELAIFNIQLLSMWRGGKYKALVSEAMLTGKGKHGWASGAGAGAGAGSDDEEGEGSMDDEE